jgi:predicted PurR-regulated permease PerM
MQQQFSFLAKITYLLLFVILFVIILVYAKDIIVPLAFGLLLSSLLYPLCMYFCKTGIPKGLSIFISILLLMVFFAGVAMFSINEIVKLSEDFPEMRVKALENINNISQYIEKNFGVGIEMQKDWSKERINNFFASGNQFVNNILNATAGTIFKILILPVFIFYILFYQERFKEFLLRLSLEHKRERNSKILKEISFISQRYFGGALVVVLILSVINSLALYIIGLKYPILFGVISAIFNFIPYFGTWIGAFFPFTFALLTGDSFKLALSVLIVFAIIQFIENNILTPNITGGYVRLNPFITILGLIASSMVWGVAGMLLVIPFLAGLKIIFENFESTQSVAYLLGKSEDRTNQKLRKALFGFFRRKRESKI